MKVTFSTLLDVIAHGYCESFALVGQISLAIWKEASTLTLTCHEGGNGHSEPAAVAFLLTLTRYVVGDSSSPRLQHHVSTQSATALSGMVAV